MKEKLIFRNSLSFIKTYPAKGRKESNMTTMRISFLDLYCFGLEMAEITNCRPTFGVNAGKPSVRLFLTKKSGLLGVKAYEAAFNKLSNGIFGDVQIDAERFVENYAPAEMGDLTAFAEKVSNLSFCGRLRELYSCKAFVSAMKESGLRGDRMPTAAYEELCGKCGFDSVSFLQAVRTFVLRTRRTFKVSYSQKSPAGEYVIFIRVRIAADKVFVEKHFEALDRMVRNVARALRRADWV